MSEMIHEAGSTDRRTDARSTFVAFCALDARHVVGELQDHVEPFHVHVEATWEMEPLS